MTEPKTAACPHRAEWIAPRQQGSMMVCHPAYGGCGQMWMVPEARQRDGSGLRTAAWNLADSLLVDDKAETVTGGAAAILWRRDVLRAIAADARREQDR